MFPPRPFDRFAAFAPWGVGHRINLDKVWKRDVLQLACGKLKIDIRLAKAHGRVAMPIFTWSEWAAWAQVLVAAAGFLAAIGVPAFQRWTEIRDRQRDAARKARALALYLRPAIEDWLARLSLVADDIQMRELDVSSPSEFLNAILSRDALIPPVRLRRQLDALYALAGVGDDLFDALAAAYECRTRAQAVLLEVFEADSDQSVRAGAEAADRIFVKVQEHLIRARAVMIEIVDTKGADRLAALIRKSN